MLTISDYSDSLLTAVIKLSVHPIEKSCENFVAYYIQWKRAFCYSGLWSWKYFFPLLHSLAYKFISYKPFRTILPTNRHLLPVQKSLVYKGSCWGLMKQVFYPGRPRYVWDYVRMCAGMIASGMSCCMTMLRVSWWQLLGGHVWQCWVCVGMIATGAPCWMTMTDNCWWQVFLSFISGWQGTRTLIINESSIWHVPEGWREGGLSCKRWNLSLLDGAKCHIGKAFILSMRE